MPSTGLRSAIHRTTQSGEQLLEKVTLLQAIGKMALAFTPLEPITAF